MAASVHASLTARAAQTTDQRQRQSMHREGESSADYAATAELRQLQSICIETVRAGQTIATAAQRHCYLDGESGADYASLWRRDGSD